MKTLDLILSPSKDEANTQPHPKLSKVLILSLSKDEATFSGNFSILLEAGWRPRCVRDGDRCHSAAASAGHGMLGDPGGA